MDLYWVVWLFGFFLVAELYAQIFHKLTLSRWVWNHFDSSWKRGVFVCFWNAVGFHLAAHASVWWVIGTGVPFSGIILWRYRSWLNR